MTTHGFTSADLEVLPCDNKRYEVIDGQLFESRTPHTFHQIVCSPNLPDFDASLE